MVDITSDIVVGLKKWLGDEGIIFFTKMVLEYGEISPVYNEGENRYAHAVHFHEGMRVRNFLRKELCKEWTHEDLDNNWIEIVRLAILKEK